MGSSDKLSASLGSAREVVKSVFMFLIIAGIGPGLVFVGVSGLIEQGEEFSFWGDYYGPDSPEFAGEVIWEGTTDYSWTSRLTTDPGEIRVWVEEGKTVDVSVPRSGASFERCYPSECDYFNNANESIPGYQFIGYIHVDINNTYDVQFTSTGDNTETTMIIVTKEKFPTPGIVLILMTLAGTIVTCIAIFFVYYTTKEMREESKNNNGKKESVSKNNWIGPDGTESGPDVPEEWYLTYDGPAPVVEEIYDENYAVDRGNGTIPVDFYIKTWGVPEGFGKTDHEKKWSMDQTWWKGQESGLGDDDKAVPSKLDKDFATEPISVIGFIVLSFFTALPAVLFGAIGVYVMLFSIINPYHEDGGIFGFVCFGIPFSLAGLVCLLIWLAGVIKERLRVHHSRDQLVFQATILGLGLPPLRGLSLLSEKRRLSEAVYLETDRDGDDWSDAMVHGRSSEGVEWELDICGVVSELAEPENPYNPPYEKKAREIAEAIGIEFRIVQDSDVGDKPEPIPFGQDREFISDPTGAVSGTIAILFASIFSAIWVIGSVEEISFEEIPIGEMGLSELPYLLMGLSLLLGPLIMLGWLFKIFSGYRLRVQHSTDLLVFDSTFRGRSWRVKERRLSESLYLRYNTWTETDTDSDGNRTTTRHHEYEIHGHSDEEGEWKLDITSLVETFDYDSKEMAREIAKAIGIEFRREAFDDVISHS